MYLRGFYNLLLKNNWCKPFQTGRTDTFDKLSLCCVGKDNNESLKRGFERWEGKKTFSKGAGIN